MEQDRNRISLGDLPLELIELICEYCDDRALLERLPRVAKVFWTILSNDNFWRRASHAKKIKYVEYDASKSCRYNYQKNLPYNPMVQWSEVTCHGEVKDRLREGRNCKDEVQPIFIDYFMRPHKFPTELKALDRDRARTALLYGPYGVDKSLLAKAVACEAKATFFSLRCSDLLKEDEGHPEKKLQDLFTLVRKHTPSILFLEEIESLDKLTKLDAMNERVKLEFLVQCRRHCEGLYVMAATEAPWDICPTVFGRFEKRIDVDLPDPYPYLKLLKQQLETFPSEFTNEEFIQVGNLMRNYSPDDVAYVIKESSKRITRLVLDATHFKLVQAPSEKDPNIMCEYYTPCSPDDQSGTPMTARDIRPAKLLVPKLNKRYFELALAELKPVNTKEQL